MPVTARPATPADAPDIVELQHRWDTHWFGAAEHDESDVRAELRRAERLADRSRLLLNGRRLVAAAWWWRPDDPAVLVDPETDTGAAARELMVWLARGGADTMEVLSRDTVSTAWSTSRPAGPTSPVTPRAT